MILSEMTATIEALVQPGKGILAADESTNTIGKRFHAIKVDNNEDNRKQYRSLLSTTDKLEQYISGVILFEETLEQTTITNAFSNKNIIPGIKVDKGLTTLYAESNEKITQGLDGLQERLKKYKEQGARFAKWRNVYSIENSMPSKLCLKANSKNLAHYAKICQSLGIVPIVEPELLMDGYHTLEDCASASEAIIHAVFNSLIKYKVILEYIILKPNMILPGVSCTTEYNAEQIAIATIKTLRRTVPAAVPSINFLSGGQSASQATINLNAINQYSPQPWLLSFSFGRALQENCLKAWGGQVAQVSSAQQALLTSAKNNSMATQGKYTEIITESA